jgi:hypothetical protein
VVLVQVGVMLQAATAAANSTCVVGAVAAGRMARSGAAGASRWVLNELNVSHFFFVHMLRPFTQFSCGQTHCTAHGPHGGTAPNHASSSLSRCSCATLTICLCRRCACAGVVLLNRVPEDALERGWPQEAVQGSPRLCYFSGMCCRCRCDDELNARCCECALHRRCHRKEGICRHVSPHCRRQGVRL